MKRRLLGTTVLGSVIVVTVLAVCVGAPMLVWTNLIAEYNELDACPGFVNDEPGSKDLFTEIEPPGGEDVPEFGEVMSVGDLTLTSYRSLSFSSSDAAPIPDYDTRVIKADGSGYRKVPVKWVVDISVAPDRRHAAVLKGTGDEDTFDEYLPTARLGVQDLATGDVDWMKLPENAEAVAWSPTDDTVLVSTEKEGEVLLVDTGSKKIETIGLPKRYSHNPPGDVAWNEDGESFIVTDSGEWDDSEDSASVVVGLDGETEPFPVGLDAGETGLSPSGTRAELQTDGDLEHRIVDVKTGEVATGPGFTACSNYGNVHELFPKAWFDDDHLIAVESETYWPMDKRWGEPGQAARGDRLVVVDLDGKVTRAITEWGTSIPEYYEFHRPGG